MNKKLYILCNRRLSPVYAAVQGAHALAQWILEHPGQYHEFTTLIFLNCNLPKKIEHMKENGYDFSVWAEPDLNMTPTAAACFGDDNLIFTRLKTLG